MYLHKFKLYLKGYRVERERERNKGFRAGSSAYKYPALATRFHKLRHTEKMGSSSSMWTVCVILASLASAALCANPRRPVDVQFGRNYVPTWAFDHIKYFNGGSDIQLHLDKYTGAYNFFIPM